MSNRAISWIVFILLCLIWGSSFILMKVSLQGLTPPQIAGVRIFSAAIVFLPFALFHFRQVPKARLGIILLTGIFGNLLPAFLFAAAILRIDSSLTGILNSLTPLCVVVIGIAFFRNRISTRKILGVVVGFIGLCLLSVTQSGISLANAGYAGLVLLATVSYGLNVNLVSYYLKGVHPVKAATISLSFMALPAGIILYLEGFMDLDFHNPHVQWSLLNCILLGVVGSAIATALFYILVQKAGGLFASLVTYGIPFVALGWGFLAGESISWIAILCLLVILTGVFMANWPEQKKTPAPGETGAV